MAKVRSRILVIDASIARAAGQTSEHPKSRQCRDFLETVLDVCHQMAMTDSIKQEWNTHQSKFARRWRVSMMAKQKICTAEVGPELKPICWVNPSKLEERAIQWLESGAPLDRHRRLDQTASKPGK